MHDSKVGVVALYKISAYLLCMFSAFGKTCRFVGFFTVIVDCRGAVARVRDSYTDDPSSIPVRLVVASW